MPDTDEWMEAYGRARAIVASRRDRLIALGLIDADDIINEYIDWADEIGVANDAIDHVAAEKGLRDPELDRLGAAYQAVQRELAGLSRG